MNIIIKESIRFSLEAYWDEKTNQRLDMLVGVGSTSEERRYASAVALLSDSKEEVETAYEAIYESLLHV